MLIGISGYIGVGKDTVAKMIQLFMLYYNPTPHTKRTIESWRNSGSDIDFVREWMKPVYKDRNFPNEGHWEIKKFAGKLKQICSLLTGIPVSEFEQQSVKDSFLGPEWDYTTYRVNDQIFYKTTAKRAVPINNRMTVRDLLQKVGTDAMRNQVHSNIHINALFADYKANIEGRKTPQISGGFGGGNVIGVPVYPNWIISDLRFLNEAQAIKDRGGVCIRINRSSQELPVDSITGKKLMDYPRHESETALDNYQFDAVIENNDSLEVLLKNVQATLYTLNLLK